MLYCNKVIDFQFHNVVEAIQKSHLVHLPVSCLYFASWLCLTSFGLSSRALVLLGGFNSSYICKNTYIFSKLFRYVNYALNM